MRRAIVRVFNVIFKIAMCAVITISLFLLACCAVRQYERYTVIDQFKKNQILYNSLISSAPSASYTSNNVKHFYITTELEKIGIVDVYELKTSICFEQGDRVLGMFPHGIVYAIDSNDLPNWFIIESIFPQWYYYRIV